MGPTIGSMGWATALVAAGGVLVGAVVAVLVGRARAGRMRAGPARAGRARRGGEDRRAAITTDTSDPRGGLARKTLDSLRVGVVVLDPADQPVLMNPSARAMGLLRAGSGPGTIAAHPVLRSLAAQVRRSGVRREVELELARGSGGRAEDPLGVLLRAVGLGGDYVAIEGADVTEAHRVARVRRDFVANVGHELKTPIGALQLLSEALLDATDPAPCPGPERRTAERAEVLAPDLADDPPAARRFAERIHHESTRLGRLVSELLELSRVQGADPLPVLRPVSVDWLVAEVLDRTRTGAAAKQIEVREVGKRGLTVYGSDRQLATALANLVENAVSYSPEGSRVEVRSGRGGQGDPDWSGGSVDVAVVDRGIGIVAADLDRIFERFYRSDQARSRATGGTGLGLAIVKHIATNHGGRVEVSSTPGEGSTFTLRLPARPPGVVAAPPAPDEIDADREWEPPAGTVPTAASGGRGQP